MVNCDVICSVEKKIVVSFPPFHVLYPLEIFGSSYILLNTLGQTS